MDVPAPIVPIDVRVTAWMAKHGIGFTRVALGLVFFWFGVLKFIPNWSPAADLAVRTIGQLTGGALSSSSSLWILAAWETAIGLGLLFGIYLRVTLLLLFLQMPGTMLPLFFFPKETFSIVPFAPTLEGQYIIKNVVLIGAAIVVGATVRGGQLSAKPVK